MSLDGVMKETKILFIFPSKSYLHLNLCFATGLSSQVQVVHGILSTKIDELKQQLKSMGASTFDFLLLKEAGLISKGTVIVADNILRPGAPAYRSYMESHKEDMDVVEHKTWLEYSSLPDIIMVSTLK
jgi:predicted O-methyltransferase YrrM